MREKRRERRRRGLAWLEVEAGEDVDEVAPHQVGGAIGGAGGDRIDQRMVRVALAGRVAPPPIERDDQRGTRDQFADEAGEDRLLGEIGHHIVEGRRQADGAALVARRDRRIFAAEMATKPGGIFRRGAAGGERRYPRLDQRARLEDLPRLGGGRLGDLGAAIGGDRHQPLMGERLQRRAHDGAARAIDGADLVFRQPRSGR